MATEGRRPPPAIPGGLEPNLLKVYAYLHHLYRSEALTAGAHSGSHLPGGLDPLPTGNPVSIGMANAPGVAEQLIRADHVHATPLTTEGDLLTVIGGGLGRLGVGANPDGYVLTKVAGVPAWAAPTGGGGGGPHALTHQAGGTDPLSILLQPGYPGGTTAFLRADATFAVPPGGGGGGTPDPHAPSHEDGGSDEIDVTGLSGVLADPQTPTVHHTSHENGGTDEINVGGLSGVLADPQTAAAHAPTHAAGGSDPASVVGLAGFPGGATTFLRADATFAVPPGTGGGGAPTDAEYLVGALHAGLSAERIVTNTPSVVWDLTTAGQAKASVPAGVIVPAAHATTHEAGGSDPVGLLDLPGYPGGTTLFLRADATFATPPGGGGGGPHAPTHEPGGGDEIDTLTGLTLTTGPWATQATTPANITAQQNNYNPGPGRFFRLTGTGGAWAISGFANGVDGRRLTLRNVGAQNIRLAHQSSASTITNRIITPTAADILLLPDQTVSLIYDATTQRWQVESPAQHLLLGAHHSDVTAAAVARGALIKGSSAGTTWTIHPIGAANTVLRCDSLDPSWGKVNLTTDVSGNLPIANGGTGQNSAIAGFNALSPLTTLGDLLYRDASNNVRLAGNTTATKKYLAMTGTGSAAAAPVWDTAPPAGAPVDAAYVTIAPAPGTLPNARGLYPFANRIEFIDNGPGAGIVIKTPQDIHTGANPTFAGLILQPAAGELVIEGSWVTQQWPTSPPSANINEYNPGNGTYFEIVPTGAYTVGGFFPVRSGKRLRFNNPSTYAWTILHENPATTAAYRVTCPGARPFVLSPGDTVDLIYNSTGRWTVAAGSKPQDDTWLTLPTISANLVDYDVGTGASFRINLTANFNVSGFANGWDGRRLRLRNVSAFTWQLRHEAATSLPQNRIVCPGAFGAPVGQKHLAIRPDEVAALTYDGTTQRWIAGRSALPIVVDIFNNVVLNTTGAALATTATDGFTLVPSCPGVPTGVPSAFTAVFTGSVPLVVDTTNFRLYAYIAGAWRQL